MSKYKMGDRVKIVSDEHLMGDVTIGKVYEIKGFDEVYSWLINDKGYRQFFGEKDKGVVKVGFTKDDLEVGMLVETRGGNKYIVMPQNRLFNISGKTYRNLNGFKGNLKHQDKYKDDFDIVKVYSYTNFSFDFECKYRKLLWERKEETIKELTMEDLERDYGCKVKVVK